MTELELILDQGREANAERFFSAGSELMQLLDELAAEPVEWILTDLRIGSSVARLSPPTSAPEATATLRLLVRGLASAGAGLPLPDGWTPDAVTAARRLCDVGGDQAPPQLVLLEDRETHPSISMTATLAARLGELQPFERTMPGAVRGVLAGVNVARGNRASLRTRSGPVIRVSFANELRGLLKDALYDDVELTGQVRQDAAGTVFHIRAEDLKVLRQPRLRWTELFGYDPEITEGMDVEDFLESARGEA